MHDDSRSLPEAECPSVETLAQCFDAVPLERRAGHHLLSHLLTPCADCWRQLHDLMPDVAADGMPCSDPLSIALYSAALGQQGRPSGRLGLMRPLHRRDAFAAAGCRAAFCRLLLHETLAVSLRLGASGSAVAFDSARRWLAATCAAPLPYRAQRDLKALAAIYQAYGCLLRGDVPTTHALVEAANQALRHGSGHHEPQVTYWTLRASMERLMAIRQGPREVHGRRAVDFLRRALRCLPVEDYAEQRAELLHEYAEAEMMLHRLASARRLLARSATLLQRLGAAAGPYLRSMVWITQSHAEARWAAQQTDAGSKLRARRRARAYFDRAESFGCMDSHDLAADRRRLDTLLAE